MAARPPFLPRTKAKASPLMNENEQKLVLELRHLIDTTVSEYGASAALTDQEIQDGFESMLSAVYDLRATRESLETIATVLTPDLPSVDWLRVSPRRCPGCGAVRDTDGWFSHPDHCPELAKMRALAGDRPPLGYVRCVECGERMDDHSLDPDRKPICPQSDPGATDDTRGT